MGLRGAIEANDADVHILVLGDSTSESYSEWAGLFAQWLGTQYPTHTVSWEAYWNSGAEDWGDTRTVSTGTGSYTIKVWVGAGGGWGMSEPTAAGVLDHPSSVDCVITATGINSVSASEWDTGIDAVRAEWGASTPITIIAQNPLASDSYGPGALQQICRDTAASRQCGLIDVEAAFIATGAPEDYISDGIHPNAEGSQLYADKVAAAFLTGGLDLMPGLSAPLADAVLVLRAQRYSGSGQWLDESGNGHDTTTISGATHGVVNGRTVWSFDGTDDFMEIDHHADFDFADGEDFTIVITDYSTGDVSAVQRIISKRSAGALGWVANQTTFGGDAESVSIFRGDGTNTAIASSGADTVAVNDRFYNIAFRSDSSGDDDVTAIVDGVAGTPVSSASVTGTSAAGASIPVYVARWGGPPNDYGEITIGGIAIWRRVLTDAEIAQAEKLLTRPKQSLPTLFARIAR